MYRYKFPSNKGFFCQIEQIEQNLTKQVMRAIGAFFGAKPGKKIFNNLQYRSGTVNLNTVNSKFHLI